MKKIFLSLTFLFSIVIISSAQTDSDSIKFHIGVKAGGGVGKINVSANTNGNYSFDQKYRFGGYIGGFGEYKLSHLFDIQPEINLNTFNITTAQSNPNLLTSGLKRTLYYIDVPVLLKFNAGAAFSLVAGPQISVVLNNPSGGSSGGQWYNGGSVTSSQFTFKFPNFSAVGGAQLSFGVVRIQARYVIGLTNIGNNKLLSYSLQNSWKTSQVQFGLGYILH
ncbi:MAG: PorT family protein [Chitinophagaceae bacterium]|jgi:hypothetical protein|nr:PorT family protein [Chitinophagaceae bacterium]